MFTNSTIKKLLKHKSKLITSLNNGLRTFSLQPNPIQTLKSYIKNTKMLIEEHIRKQGNDYWKKKLTSIRKNKLSYYKQNV